jgi:zinc protease
MRKLQLIITASFLAFASGMTAQTKQLEKVEAKPGELAISYEKFQLANGLTIIVHEDHSDPMVHVNVSYHVGSAREVKDRSGFAHFFEHMLFQGSEHIRDEEHMHIVDEAGGSWNGNTTRDRTKYFETVPSNYLETALWLESDRMGFVLDSVTVRKFEVQRATVKNEKAQNETGRPYGMFDELTNQRLYPYGHPYSWTTIGYTEDLDRATLEDMKSFFLRWYGPNNACLVVTGDVNTAEVVKLAEKYFGNIPRCPEVRKMKLEPIVVPEDKYVFYVDKVNLPVTNIVYPAPPVYHNDEPAMEILARVLSDGKNSYFYKHFEKTENTFGASASYNQNFGAELSGEFKVSTTLYPGTSLDSVAKWLKESYEDFEKNGASDDAMTRAKSQLYSEFTRGMESINGKAEILGDWWLYAPRTMNLKDEVDRFNRVTKEDLMRVYNKYLKGKGAAWITIQPKGTNIADGSDAATTTTAAATNQAPVTIPDEYKGLVYKKGTDNFDRNIHPTPGPAKETPAQQIWKQDFENGLKILGAEAHEIPVVRLRLTIKGGEMMDAKNMDKLGLSAMVAQMMTGGTKSYTAEEYENALDKMGSSVSVGSSDEGMVLTLSSMANNLDATLKLLEERLFYSKFDPADFKRIKKETKEGLGNLDYNTNAVGFVVYGKIMYGGNVLGLIPTERTIKNISLEDVQAFYDNYFSPSISEIIVSGDVTKDQIIPKLDFLKNWKAKAVEIPGVPDLYQTEPTKIYFVDRPEAPQSVIRIGYMALPYSTTGEIFKANMMNFMFSGAFNGRLNQNIRETHGWTYGIGGGFSGDKDKGTFDIGASIKSAATDSALGEIFKEMNDFRNGGITDDDTRFTKNAIINGMAIRYETTGGKMGLLSTMMKYQLPADYTKQQAQLAATITKADLQDFAKKYLPVDKMVVVVVGDKDTLKKRIEKLKIAPLEEVKDFRNAPFNTKNRVKWVKKD